LKKGLTGVWKSEKNKKEERKEGVGYVGRRLAERFCYYLFLDLVDVG
jgi:hypothetical protein